MRTAIHESDRQLALVTFCLTLLIPIPFALFILELLGRGWKKLILLWLWAEIGLAVLAIPAILFTGQWQIWNEINGIVIIGGTLLILLNVTVIRQSSSSLERNLTWPLIIFAIVVILTNRGYRPAGLDIEPFGFVILLAALAAEAFRHAVARERKLVEVENELTTARRIQTAIIPNSPPNVPGLDIASRYQPMTAVAGDFFDFLQTTETELTILVADVSGHGVASALIASMLKVCFAAQREHAQDPAKVLAGLNNMLRGSLGGQYVTAACAAIDLSLGTITYAGAGHPPSLLLRTHKRDVLPLAENGLLLGPFPQATYSNISVPFDRGDKLLLYTDGILEATGPTGEEFGLTNLEQLLLDTQNSSPTEFIEKLFRRIFTPSQQDDLTVVLTQL
jgi:serine phosphatase RsbU (regulator of sigma subunit)